MTRRATLAGRLVLAGALLAATWPACRSLLTRGEPTIDELLQLRCSSQAAQDVRLSGRRSLGDGRSAASAEPARGGRSNTRPLLQPLAGD